MARKKYATEEERKAAKKAYIRKWRAENKDKVAKQKERDYQKHMEARKTYVANWYQEHKEEIIEKAVKHRQTKEGRAKNLIANYKRIDKKFNSDTDLTVPWFVRNIFTKCIYCGESDWKKIGCDRIDNSKGHTIENVVPACWDCNNNRKNKPFEQFYMESKHQNFAEIYMFN